MKVSKLSLLFCLSIFFTGWQYKAWAQGIDRSIGYPAAFNRISCKRSPDSTPSLPHATGLNYYDSQGLSNYDYHRKLKVRTEDSQRAERLRAERARLERDRSLVQGSGSRIPYSICGLSPDRFGGGGLPLQGSGTPVPYSFCGTPTWDRLANSLSYKDKNLSVCNTTMKCNQRPYTVMPKIAAPLHQAKQAYDAGDFQGALRIIQSAKYSSSEAAEAHYLKACAYERLSKIDEACKEFKLAKLLDKSGRVAPQAQQAISNLEMSARVKLPLAVVSPVVQSSAPGLWNQASRKDPDEARSCAYRIIGQSKERINQIWDEHGARPSPSLGTCGNPSFISDTIPGAGYSGGPYYGQVGWCGTGPRISNDPSGPWQTGSGGFKGRYRYIPYQSQRYFDNPASRHAQAKAGSVADSAEGLLKLLSRVDDGKGVFLVPEGTNLYVRNYEFGASLVPPPVELKVSEPYLALPASSKEAKSK